MIGNRELNTLVDCSLSQLANINKEVRRYLSRIYIDKKKKHPASKRVKHQYEFLFGELEIGMQMLKEAFGHIKASTKVSKKFYVEIEEGEEK